MFEMIQMILTMPEMLLYPYLFLNESKSRVADPRGNQDLHFKMADKRFLIALHHGYVTCFHVSSIKQVNMAANEHGLFEYIELSFFISCQFLK